MSIDTSKILSSIGGFAYIHSIITEMSLIGCLDNGLLSCIAFITLLTIELEPSDSEEPE